MPALPHQLLSIDQCSVAVATLPATEASEGTLVWLHGLGAASTITFAEVAQDTALAGISSVLVDLPGAGHSRAPETWGCTIEDLAAVVLRVIETVPDGPVVLFGHSLGGSVAIVAAAQRPDVIPHLIVAEPNLDPGVGTISVTIARQAEEDFVAYGYGRLLGATSRLARQGSVEAASWLTTLQLANPRLLHRAATSLLAPRRPTFRQQLLDMTIPVSNITGELTPPTLPPLPDHLSSRGYVVPNAGHRMFEDNPAAFVAILTDVISQAAH